VQERKWLEIYGVGNFDLKFDAEQALGARRTHESILVTRLHRLFCDTLSNIA